MPQEQLQVSQNLSSSEGGSASSSDSWRPANQTLSGQPRYDASETFSKICDFIPSKAEEINPSHRGLYSRLSDLLTDDGEHVVQAFYDDIFKRSLSMRIGRVDRRITASKLGLDDIHVLGCRSWRHSTVHRSLENLLRPIVSPQEPAAQDPVSELSTVVEGTATSGSISRLSSATGLKAPDQLVNARTSIVEDSRGGSSRVIKYCLPALCIEYKPNPFCMFKLLCQIVAYASQIYFACGSYMSVMVRHTRYARLVTLDELTIAVEVTRSDQTRIMNEAIYSSPSTPISHSILRSIDPEVAPVRTVRSVKHLFLGRGSITPPNLLAVLTDDLLPQCNAEELARLYDFQRVAVDELMHMRYDEPLNALPAIPESDLRQLLQSLDHCTGFDVQTQELAYTLRKRKIQAAKWKASPHSEAQGIQHSRQRQRQEGVTNFTDDNTPDDNHYTQRAETDDIWPDDSVSQTGENDFDEAIATAVSDHHILFLSELQMDGIVKGLDAIAMRQRSLNTNNEGPLVEQMTEAVCLEDRGESSTMHLHIGSHGE